MKDSDRYRMHAVAEAHAMLMRAAIAGSGWRREGDRLEIDVAGGTATLQRTSATLRLTDTRRLATLDVPATAADRIAPGSRNLEPEAVASLLATLAAGNSDEVEDSGPRLREAAFAPVAIDGDEGARRWVHAIAWTLMARHPGESWHVEHVASFAGAPSSLLIWSDMPNRNDHELDERAGAALMAEVRPSYGYLTGTSDQSERARTTTGQPRLGRSVAGPRRDCIRLYARTSADDTVASLREMAVAAAFLASRGLDGGCVVPTPTSRHRAHVAGAGAWIPRRPLDDDLTAILDGIGVGFTAHLQMRRAAAACPDPRFWYIVPDPESEDDQRYLVPGHASRSTNLVDRCHAGIANALWDMGHLDDDDELSGRMGRRVVRVSADFAAIVHRARTSSILAGRAMTTARDRADGPGRVAPGIAVTGAGARGHAWLVHDRDGLRCAPIEPRESLEQATARLRPARGGRLLPAVCVDGLAWLDHLPTAALRRAAAALPAEWRIHHDRSDDMAIRTNAMLERSDAFLALGIALAPSDLGRA